MNHWFIVILLFISTISPTSGLVLQMRKERNMAPIYRPITDNQKSYVASLQGSIINVAIGPAGTGKTLFACNHAMQELKKRSIDKIIITRPVVPVEEDIGYLPGKLNSKMEPWTRPLFDIFHEYYDVKTVAQMLQCGVIEIAPLAYMRGRTFKNALIIADEMQNSSPSQMLMIATRLGSRSKLIITGDLKQSDRMEDNGLKDFLQKKREYDKTLGQSHQTNTDISITQFDESDIQRSTIVTEVLKIYGEIISGVPLTSKTVPLTSKTVPLTSKTEERWRLSREMKTTSDAAIIPLSDMERVLKNTMKK